MENRRVLTDTSVIIEFLRKEKKEKSWLWKIKETSDCFMSSITIQHEFHRAPQDCDSIRNQ
jgi:hypothetical protein